MYRHTSRVCNKKIYDVVSNHNRLVYHYLKIFYCLREFNIRRSKCNALYYETGKYNSYQLNSNRIIGFSFLESNIVWSWKRINNGSSKSNWHKFEIVEVFCRATTIMQLCDLICSTKSCSQKAFFFNLFHSMSVPYNSLNLLVKSMYDTAQDIEYAAANSVHISKPVFELLLIWNYFDHFYFTNPNRHYLKCLDKNTTCYIIWNILFRICYFFAK